MTGAREPRDAPRHALWEILESRELISRPPRLTVSAETVRLPDGRRIDDFYRVQLVDYAQIIAEGPDGRFLMIRQYKHGARRVSLTFPAGGLDPGEPPLDAAKRELLEEAGAVAAGWSALGGYVVGGNAGVATMHLFRATGVRQIQPPDAGDLEEMELLWLDRDQLKAAWRQGEFVLLAASFALTRLFAAALDEP
jgi:ADP-ribose pyrophosphatase